MDTIGSTTAQSPGHTLARDEPLSVAWDSIFRPGEAVFHLPPAGAPHPLNLAAHTLLSGWMEEDVALFREAVTSSDETAKQTVDELIVGHADSVSRLQTISLRLADGAGLICMAKDISLERELYLALSDSRRRYRDFAALSTAMAWETGPDGRFTFISAAGALGFSADELLAIDPKSLLAERDQSDETPFSRQVRIDRLEVFLWRKDGEIASVELSSLPIFAPDGHFIGARGLCSDITELRLSQSTSYRNRTQIEAMVKIAEVQLEDDGSRTKSLAETVRQLFGATGVQLAAPETSARPSSWRIISQSGLTAVLPGDERDPLRRALDRTDVSAVTYDGWHVLVIPLPNEGDTRAAVLLWRRDIMGPWPNDQRRLAEGLKEILTLQTARLLDRRSGSHEVTLGRSREKAISALQRGIRRSLFAGNESALAVFTFGGINDAQCSPSLDALTRRLQSGMSEMVRGHDLVLALDAGRLAIWLDRIVPDAARVRAQFLAEDIATRLTGCLELDCCVTPVSCEVLPISAAEVLDADAFVAAACMSRGRFGDHGKSRDHQLAFPALGKGASP